MAPRIPMWGTAVAVLLLIAACGSGKEGAPGATQSSSAACAENPANVVLQPSDSTYTPVIASSDLAVGAHRLVLGLLDPDGQPVTGARLHLRIYCVTGSGEQVTKIETDP